MVKNLKKKTKLKNGLAEKNHFSAKIDLSKSIFGFLSFKSARLIFCDWSSESSFVADSSSLIFSSSSFSIGEFPTNIEKEIRKLSVQGSCACGAPNLQNWLP